MLGINSQTFADRQEPNEQTDFFEMSLEQLAVEPYVTKVTTASKRTEKIQDAPGIISVITKDEIRMFGAKNLLDVLSRMPSVYTNGSYMFPQNIASVRGDMATHVNNHTLVLINGRPVRESLLGGLNYPVFTAYPIEMIERIELVRGPGSVLYGTNAYTAVLNIITKHSDKTTLTLAAEAGSFGYHSQTIAGGIKTDNFSIYSAGQIFSDDGWRLNAVDELGTSGSLDQGQNSGSIATHGNYGPFTFDFFWTRQQLNHFGKMPRWSLSGSSIETERLFADLGYNLKLNDNWRIDSHIGLNYSDLTYEADTAWRKSIDILGEVTLFGSPTENLDIITGFLIEHQAAPQMSQSSINGYSRLPLAVYTQLDYQPVEWLKLIGGMQWNKPDSGDSDIITRAGAIITLTPNWGVKLLRGEAFRAPWPIETNMWHPPVLVGNSDLKPEKITTYDTQLFYHDEKKQFALTYFQSNLKNLIARDTSVTPPSYMNAGQMDFWGLEFEGKYNFNPNLYALGSVTHQESTQDSSINPSSVPNTMGKLGIGYQKDKISMGLFYTCLSTPPAIAGATQANPQPNSVHWVTANLNYDVTDCIALDRGNAVFTLRLENLLDQEVHYPEFNRRQINSLPGDSGLVIYAGLRIDF